MAAGSMEKALTSAGWRGTMMGLSNWLLSQVSWGEPKSLPCSKGCPTVSGVGGAAGQPWWATRASPFPDELRRRSARTSTGTRSAFVVGPEWPQRACGRSRAAL